MKTKLFVACEIQYFELRIFSFNSCVYYLYRGFIVSTRAFNLTTRAFNLTTRAFNLATRTFSLLTRGFELITSGFELVTRRLEPVTRGFELVTRGFELITRAFELLTRGSELLTRGFELITCGFELVTRNSCFTLPRKNTMFYTDLCINQVLAVVEKYKHHQSIISINKKMRQKEIALLSNKKVSRTSDIPVKMIKENRDLIAHFVLRNFNKAL